MIYYNSNTINDWNFGDDNIAKVYYGVTNTSRLPSGYTEVEYIQRDASHDGYVGLGEYFQENTKIEIDFQMTQAKGNAIIGDYGSNDNDDWRVFLNYDSNVNNLMNYDFLATRIQSNTGDWSKRFHIEIGNYYIKDLDSGSYIVKGTSKSNFTRPNQMYLFHMNGSQNTNNIDYGKIYSVKIWQNNTLVKDFVPCFRNSDNLVGLYDIVGNEFHGSLESTLIAGSAVTPSSSTSRLPSGYTEVEYVQNNTQGAYINTGLLLYDATGNSFSISAKLKSQYESTWEGDGYYLQTIINSEDVSSPYYGFTFRYAWKTHILECTSNPSNSVTFSSTANTDGTSSLTINCNSTTVTNQVPLGLFASYNGNYNTPYRFSNATIYSFQVTKNNTLVRDLVPCIRDNDNMVGMYDVVNDVFYYPPNYQSYQLVAGSAVTPSSMSGRLVYQKITNGSTPPTPPTPPIDYANEYLTFVAQSDGVTIGLSNASTNIFQYSLDSGSTWNNLVNKQSTPSINNGDKIMFKASGLSVDGEKGIGRLYPSASASVEGNVMSLIYGDDFSGQTAIPNNFQLRRLFSGATNLTSAENFVIPATSLRKQCYSGMFQACTSLTKTPKAIGSSAMTWNGSDYVMSDMFHGCTSLTTVPSGLLPALNLGNQCYWYMFEDCSSLTETPHLLATEAATQCYQGMFKKCSNLNNVTCLLRNPSTYNEWLDGVAANGTFYKNSNASWSSGSNGIPTNWTVVDYTT